jgi:hypothetical protein
MFKARIFAALIAAFISSAAIAQVDNPGVPVSGAPANNDCAKFVVSGGNVQSITTAGAACGAGGAIVNSFAGRTGTVVPVLGDYSFSLISGQWSLTQGPTLGANTVLGSVAGGTPIALSQAQLTAMLNLATTSLQGAVPAWPNDATKFFNGVGGYTVPPGTYSLPTATASVLGGVKPDGTTITNSAGSISVTYGAGFSAQVIASGAKALATGSISSATCTTAQTDTATGVLTTDAIAASFNGDPTAVTGYVPLTSGMLTIIVYPTANVVNFKVCNNTAGTITPGAITINWRVVR